MFSQAQLDDYIRRLEETEKNMRIAEAKIAERDQRIIEVERLLDCMSKVRHIQRLNSHMLPLLKAKVVN